MEFQGLPSAALTVQHRHRPFSAFINLDEPDVALRHVREEIDALASAGLENSMQHLHKLVNIALCHLQRGDLVLAQECARYAHDKIVEVRGSQCTALFFSSKTAARCCDALADAYEQHLAEIASLSHNSDALMPGPSKALTPSRFIQKLRGDAVRYRATADRIYNNPRNFWMRSGLRSDKGWDDTSCSAAADEAHPHSSAADPKYPNRRRHSEQQLRRKQIAKQMGVAYTSK